MVSESSCCFIEKFNEEGFIFYTNYESEKGKAIEANPNVCLSFFWHSMERQVIIKGIAEKTSAQLSDNYFDSRPDGSKLGAIVSNQSRVIESRTVLEEKLKVLESEFEGKRFQDQLFGVDF
jgi:pyridoxamine 5'-phosphate oxidase